MTWNDGLAQDLNPQSLAYIVLINTPSLNPIIETDSVLSKCLKSLKLQRTDAINHEELFQSPQIVADWPGIGTQQDAHVKKMK